MRFALDAKSMRYDAGNDYFHVELSPLTKAQVAQYRGYEIGEAKEHGLDLHKIYNVYRPPEELSKPETVKSVIGIPITLEHEFIDPEHKPQQQVGMTGDHAVWRAPYLMNSLHITSAEAQRRIEDGSMRQISLGYTYEPLWRSGTTPEGEHYDLVMTNIRANHVALVEEGRAGDDVLVLDDNKSLTAKEVPNHMDESVKQALMALVQSAQSLLAQSGNGEGAAPAGVVGDEDEPISVDEQEQTQDEELTEEAEKEGADLASDEDEDAAAAEATDEDEAACDEDEVCDEDSEQACDEDEEACDEEEGEQPENEDDGGLALDSDEAQELLAKYDLDGASDEVKMGFLQGFKACSAQKSQGADSARAMRKAKRKFGRASDSKKGRRVSLKKASPAVFVGRSIESRLAAADHVMNTLGRVQAYSYRSAADIYRAALKKLGVYTTDSALPLSVLRESYKVAVSAARKRPATLVRSGDRAPLDNAASKYISTVRKQIRIGD